MIGGKARQAALQPTRDSPRDCAHRLTVQVNSTQFAQFCKDAKLSFGTNTRFGSALHTVA